MASRGRRITADAGTPRTAETGWPAWADPVAERRLRDSLREGRIGHAYLLSGPRGVGKAELARAFAQALCCTNIDERDRSRPCGACRACRNVLRGTHPDVEVFNLETQAMLADKPASRGTLSIDTVRRLRSSAALLPLESKHRVVIVDDAETLLEPAQQALLKTLEEPPPVVTLLLLTDEVEALLETVRSRCQQVPVRPMPEALVNSALLERGVAAPVAAEIASLSRGCPAWAIAAASDKKLLGDRISERDAAVAWVSSARYDRLVTAFKLGEQFSKRRAEVIGVVQAATQLLRELMIRATDDDQRRDGAAAPAMAGVSALAMSGAVAASLQCLVDLEANVRPRLALEAMVMQWPNMELPPA